MSVYPSDRLEYRQGYQREYKARFRAKHGMSSSAAQRKANSVTAAKHRETEKRRYVAYGRRNRMQLRDEVFEAYGGFVCACCGESGRHFLSLDHIFNNGAEEKRRGFRGGATLHRRLKQQGFPKGYQVLCYNCNCGKRVNGGICPHIEVLDEGDWQ